MVTGENTQVVPIENVCVADEDKVLCIVRNMLDSDGGKHTLNLPVSMTVGSMVKEVAKMFSYVADTISVHYEKPVGAGLEEMILEQLEDKSLVDICAYGVKRHDFTLNEREDVLPQKAETTVEQTESTDNESDTVASTSSAYFSTASTSTGDTYASYSTYPENSYSSYASAVIKSDTGYVGLVNQAMTCYLNSLLQTLYMTPEFRNALYRWSPYGIEDKAKSIPFQLQTLFLQLQTSKKRAAETTDLTRSFGWDSSEVWQQHDVQELCRVMFDALELNWKNTDQAHLINNLYQGKMKDYVKCLECHNENARVVAYLDIQLVIRPFGAEVTYGSVDEALDAFVQPEILNDSNQYFCEKCNKKCDAHKGLKFVSFPYLLTLQLKRFDFDYSTMHRIKLNDRMSFSEVLNLNHLVDRDSETSITGDNVNINSDTTPNSVIEDSGDEGIDEGIEVENGASGTSSGSDSSSLSSEAAANDKNAKELEYKGPFVYELFSIMIHSGSAAGGHYYAYIKSFKDGQWYCFNDQHVSKITYDDITKTYGGNSTARGYYSATYSSSTNAYMLMYRQIDKKRNADFIIPENFPEHLKKHLQQIQDREEAEKRQRELDKSTCKIKVFCFHPIQRKRVEQKLEVHKDKTLAEATEMVYKLYDLDKYLPLDCVRLVKYDEYQDSLERSFEGEEETPMGKLLGGVKQTYNFDLLLETKRPEQQFQEYKPGGVTIKLFVADLATESIHEPISVRAYQTQTVADFKKIVSDVLNVPDTHMRFVLERFHNDLKFLSVPTKTLKSEGFFRSNKVYVEYSGDEEEDKVIFPDSKFYKLLDRYQNTIRIHVNLPSIEDVEEFHKQSVRQNKLYNQSVKNSVITDDKVKFQIGNDSLEVDEGISDRGSESELELKLKSISMTKSHSDPSIYHRYTTTTTSDNVRHSRTSSPLHGQSSNSQDTSTSAEFSLPTNGSVSLDGQGEDTQSAEESNDPVEHGDTDSDQQTSPPSPVEGSQQISPPSPVEGSQLILPPSPAEGSQQTSLPSPVEGSQQTSPPSPVGGSKDLDFSKREQREDWDAEIESDNDVIIRNVEIPKKYFHVIQEDVDILTKQRQLTVLVDKRITLGAFKTELESFVGSTSDNFKVYRVYSNNQEFESIRLSETLSFFEDGKLNIKLGRALKPGEYRVKVYQLLLNDTEPSKFLIDTIFAKGMSVLESKKMILPEIKEQCNLDLSFDRVRLRKKTWKNPGTVYVDAQLYEEDIPIFANWEVFLQVLDGPEKMTCNSYLAIFVRRWRPSNFSLDPFQEIILTQQTIEELKQKLAEVSGLPEENIEYAKGRGTFPCDVSLMEIHTDLDWSPYVTTLNTWPLYICDDGNVLYYRDKTEKLMELSEEQKKELQQKENARLSRGTHRSSYSPRKERALKIYTEDIPQSSSSKSSPDLD